jgi:hypothetical protein
MDIQVCAFAFVAVIYTLVVLVTGNPPCLPVGHMMYQWHCFIQALADGSTPEAFFAHLSASQ